MKTQTILVPLAATALLVWVTGCEKKDASVQDQTRPMADETGAVQKRAEAVQETGAKAITDVAEQAQAAAAPASSKAQEIIDSAKSLVGEGKFQDALAKLKELSGEKLSAAQQSAVDALQAQIQKALGAKTPAAPDAAGAAGNLLKH
jgi:dsDNA-specific endonuclease/ATPase MutS2